MKLKALWFNPLSQSMNLSDPLFSHTSQGSMFSSVRISTKFSFILRQNMLLVLFFPVWLRSLFCVMVIWLFLSTPSLLTLNWRVPLSFPPVNIPLTFFKFNFDFILEYAWFTVLHFKNDTNDLNLQNRCRLTESENKFMFTKGERCGEG